MIYWVCFAVLSVILWPLRSVASKRLQEVKADRYRRNNEVGQPQFDTFEEADRSRKDLWRKDALKTILHLAAMLSTGFAVISFIAWLIN